MNDPVAVELWLRLDPVFLRRNHQARLSRGRRTKEREAYKRAPNEKCTHWFRGKDKENGDQCKSYFPCIHPFLAWLFDTLARRINVIKADGARDIERSYGGLEMRVHPLPDLLLNGSVVGLGEKNRLSIGQAFGLVGERLGRRSDGRQDWLIRGKAFEER